MAHLIRQQYTHFEDRDGRRVPKGTKGAKKVKGGIRQVVRLRHPRPRCHASPLGHCYKEGASALSTSW